MSTAVTRYLPQDTDPLAARRLGYSLCVSAAVHCVLLATAFILLPPLLNWQAPTLDIILVNAKTLKADSQARALAQANLQGGGERADNVRAKTFLPALEQERRGDDFITTRPKSLSAQSVTGLRRLTANQAKNKVASQAIRPMAPATVAPLPGTNDRQRDLAIMQMRAEIDRRIEEYNKRPRRTFVGADTKEYHLAQYVEEWRQKVERMGNLNYPTAARGRYYGSLILTVAIYRDGTIEKVVVSKPSPYPVLDRAAENIVRMAGPYQPLPDNSNTDILEITRTWTFTNDDRLESHAGP